MKLHGQRTSPPHPVRPGDQGGGRAASHAPRALRGHRHQAPKGVILYGCPGTGKTLLAKAVANSTSATFLRVVGSELIQKYLGDGPKLVRELFRVADENSPSIVFIDEIDAIGTKRYDTNSAASAKSSAPCLSSSTSSTALTPCQRSRCAPVPMTPDTCTCAQQGAQAQAAVPSGAAAQRWWHACREGCRMWHAGDHGDQLQRCTHRCMQVLR